MYAYNIQWDCDTINEQDSLPDVVEIPDSMTDPEDISDYLSDLTGFCHKGFELSEEMPDEPAVPERVSTDHCLKAGVAGSKGFASVSGYELQLDPKRFIDDQHLNCVFYNGVIGTFVRSDGWKIEISVHGDVSLTVHLPFGDASDLEYDNDADGEPSAVGSDFFNHCDSDLIWEQWKRDGLVEFIHNNWIEYNYIRPDGAFVACGDFCDNVFPDENVLEVFFHDSAVELFAGLEKYVNGLTPPDKPAENN